MPRSDAHESVIERATRVLESFEHDRRVLSASEISRRANIPLASTHRIINQLVDAQLLERDGNGRVRIGMHLWEIAALGSRSRELREAAMPYLEDIHAVTQQYTQLAVLDGQDSLIVEQLKARNALKGVLAHAGRRIPAHATAGGLAMLAHAGRDAQQRLLDSPLVRYTDRTPVEPRSLHGLWASVRREGWIACDGFVDARVLSIAVPVKGPDGTVIAAVSVVVPSKEASPRHHIPVLLAGARGIARELGTPHLGPTRLRGYLSTAEGAPLDRSLIE